MQRLPGTQHLNPATSVGGGVGWGAAPLSMRGEAKGLARMGRAGNLEGQGSGGAPRDEQGLLLCPG